MKSLVLFFVFWSSLSSAEAIPVNSETADIIRGRPRMDAQIAQLVGFGKAMFNVTVEGFFISGSLSNNIDYNDKLLVNLAIEAKNIIMIDLGSFKMARYFKYQGKDSARCIFYAFQKKNSLNGSYEEEYGIIYLTLFKNEKNSTLDLKLSNLTSSDGTDLIYNKAIINSCFSEDPAPVLPSNLQVENLVEQTIKIKLKPLSAP